MLLLVSVSNVFLFFACSEANFAYGVWSYLVLYLHGVAGAAALSALRFARVFVVAESSWKVLHSAWLLPVASSRRAMVELLWCTRLRVRDSAVENVVLL